LGVGLLGRKVGVLVKAAFIIFDIGRKLLSTAEAWLAASVGRIRVRANTRRADAHRFYADAGYQEVKTQKIFQKQLPE
jgi:hypothetical protein